MKGKLEMLNYEEYRGENLLLEKDDGPNSYRSVRR